MIDQKVFQWHADQRLVSRNKHLRGGPGLCRARPLFVVGRYCSNDLFVVLPVYDGHV
jgi:hypothetical protein